MGGAPTKVLNDLYLGGNDVLNDEYFFLSNNISYCLSISHNQPNESIELRRLFIRKDPLVNHVDFTNSWKEIIMFIHEARCKEKGVYIHGSTGLTSSATAILAYLMVTQPLTLEEALSFLSFKRSGVSPPQECIEQLLLLDTNFLLEECIKKFGVNHYDLVERDRQELLSISDEEIKRKSIENSKY